MSFGFLLLTQSSSIYGRLCLPLGSYETSIGVRDWVRTTTSDFLLLVSSILRGNFTLLQST